MQRATTNSSYYEIDSAQLRSSVGDWVGNAFNRVCHIAGKFDILRIQMSVLHFPSLRLLSSNI